MKYGRKTGSLKRTETGIGLGEGREEVRRIQSRHFLTLTHRPFSRSASSYCPAMGFRSPTMQ